MRITTAELIRHDGTDAQHGVHLKTANAMMSAPHTGGRRPTTLLRLTTMRRTTDANHPACSSPTLRALHVLLRTRWQTCAAGSCCPLPTCQCRLAATPSRAAAAQHSSSSMLAAVSKGDAAAIVRTAQALFQRREPPGCFVELHSSHKLMPSQTMCKSWCTSDAHDDRCT